MKTCLLGVVSWCDSGNFPHRFAAFKKCVNSLEKFIPKDLCHIAIVDNNSSRDVINFIKESSVFDTKVLLPENLHDTGALAILAKICRDLKIPYFFPLDNDHLFFRDNFLKTTLEMLEIHKECGFVRLLKFSYQDKDLYDKRKPKMVGHDKANQRWMYNIESGKPLIWEGPFTRHDLIYYINNWHWATCGPLVRLDIWDKIFPQNKRYLPVYYDSERQMRKNYQELNLKVLVLDGGAFAQIDQSVYQGTQLIYKPAFILKRLLNLINHPVSPLISVDKIKFYQSTYKRYLG